MRALPAVLLASAVLGAAPGIAQGPEAPPAGPGRVIRLGALLPLSGPGAWYGKEMRQGMELAAQELSPARADAAAPPASPRAADPVADADAPRDGETPRDDEVGGEAAPDPAPWLSPLDTRVAVEALDVPPLDVHDAGEELRRLAALPVAAVFTASATPTATVYPLAAARDLALVHLGVPGDRLAPGARLLLLARAPVGARVDALLAHGRERGFRRLALVTAGDEFGAAVRARVSAGTAGGRPALVHVESATLEAPDLGARLRVVARTAPDAVILGFRGPDLGDAARLLRHAGYRGPLLGVDDDRAALLAAAGGLEGALLVTDAFVPETGAPSGRFARAYEARFGSAPSRHAALAYESAAVVAEGLRALRADGRGPVSGRRLRDALDARRRFPSVWGGEVALRDDGTLLRPLALFVVQQDALTFVRYLPRPGGPT